MTWYTASITNHGRNLAAIDLMDTVKEIDITYDDLKDNHDVYLNDLRKDEVIESMPTSKVLSNAVNTNNCFVVPKVVE